MIVLTYELPPELEFFQRGFSLSERHEHDEGIISYIYLYENERQLIVSFEHHSINVKILDGDLVTLSLSQENIENVAFQAWGDEQIIRVYLNDSFNDVKIFYKPTARVIFHDE